MDDNVYFKKLVPLAYRGQTLRLAVSQDLFSSDQIDVGSRLLLRTLDSPDVDRRRKVLDIGCGYGPLGLALKKVRPDREVHLADRDALAVAFTSRNARLSEVGDVAVYGSLGYDDVVGRDFDLIVSNIPAKAGEPVIADLLTSAALYLRPGGLVAVVVIAPLADFVARVLHESPDISLLLERHTPTYAVFHYQFAAGPEPLALPPGAFDRGIYDAGEALVSLPGSSFTLRIVLGLTEAEGPDLSTALLVDTAGEKSVPRVHHALIFNPGQGYLPVAVALQHHPTRLTLVDRDLLSLRASRRNLVAAGYAARRIALVHQVGLATEPRGDADLIAGVLREGEGSQALAQAVAHAGERLAPGGLILLAGSSTAITRLVKVVEAGRFLRVRRRTREKGHSLLALERRP